MGWPDLSVTTTLRLMGPEVAGGAAVDTGGKLSGCCANATTLAAQHNEVSENLLHSNGRLLPFTSLVPRRVARTHPAYCGGAFSVVALVPFSAPFVPPDCGVFCVAGAVPSNGCEFAVALCGC